MLKQTQGNKGTGELQLVIFNGNEEYGIDILKVQEIADDGITEFPMHPLYRRSNKPPGTNYTRS